MLVYFHCGQRTTKRLCRCQNRFRAIFNRFLVNSQEDTLAVRFPSQCMFVGLNVTHGSCIDLIWSYSIIFCLVQFDVDAFSKLKLKLPSEPAESGDTVARFKLNGFQYAVQECTLTEADHMVNVVPDAKNKQFVLGKKTFESLSIASITTFKWDFVSTRQTICALLQCGGRLVAAAAGRREADGGIGVASSGAPRAHDHRVRFWLAFMSLLSLFIFENFFLSMIVHTAVGTAFSKPWSQWYSPQIFLSSTMIRVHGVQIPDLKVRFLPIGYVGDAPSSGSCCNFHVSISRSISFDQHSCLCPQTDSSSKKRKKSSSSSSSSASTPAPSESSKSKKSKVADDQPETEKKKKKSSKSQWIVVLFVQESASLVFVEHWQ